VIPAHATRRGNAGGGPEVYELLGIKREMSRWVHGTLRGEVQNNVPSACSFFGTDRLTPFDAQVVIIAS
jgi:hypothetical protein